jgi:cystathionine beta-lyase/cystathionine gamma-synthase
MAVSWGGHESLALPKCASLLPEQFDASDPEHRMIRFYFGLEEPEYLMNDIAQAFRK